MEQATEREKLEAELYFLNKQHSHIAEALGTALTPYDRELTKKEFDSLSKKILALRERIKVLGDSK
jgi:hypothetical protein